MKAVSTTARAVRILPVVAALALVCLLSIAMGSKPLSPIAILDALLGDAPAGDAYIVWQLRGSRTLLGLAVGAALGVSGMLIQALTRNPLADPGVLGVTSGAAFAVAVTISLLGLTSVSDYRWAALLGALAVTVLVYLIGSSGRGPIDPARLTLAGVALAAVLQGVVSALLLLDPRAFDIMRGWNAGTIASRGLEVLLPVLPLIGLGILIAAAVSPSLNAVAMGDDVAVALGVPLRTVRVLVVVAVTLLAGGATAAAGPLLFIGLMVPHIARLLVGADQRWIFAYSLLLGPILLLASDVAGRLIMMPGEIPVGILTAFVGAPVLIVLIRRRREVAA
ncbi:iron chelate uptake ABC transporter family permease subunit [Stackebrandtia nassauensis]|uniref:Transport system permease protein n=1 Tax=Stackebrandtia nassauensis (strain DSM 44728 / CIP 108903 / NRRL B-16338 / NBRC 102104 / LLR-40K-21) TaxID=446470 RepID=D3Q7F3_STANL|nr:Fe(3+)-siderophore ABC transporter permease [Stackebrandtia nassauensis]ADD42424.1 transport system permease protein [Stackebrandtia nassauensis DSM 44728]